MNGFLLLIIVPLIIIAGMSILLLIGTWLTLPTFWILLFIGIVVIIAFLFSYKKTKGYLSSVQGYVSCKGVDSSKISIVYLYPNEITVNDTQIIPIERVKKAVKTYYDRSFIHRGRKIRRERHSLTIYFQTKDGSSAELNCLTKDNPFDGGSSYIQMKKQINKLIDYVEPASESSSKPYEL